MQMAVCLRHLSSRTVSSTFVELGGLAHDTERAAARHGSTDHQLGNLDNALPAILFPRKFNTHRDFLLIWDAVPHLQGVVKSRRAVHLGEDMPASIVVRRKHKYVGRYGTRAEGNNRPQNKALRGVRAGSRVTPKELVTATALARKNRDVPKSSRRKEEQGSLDWPRVAAFKINESARSSGGVL